MVLGDHLRNTVDAAVAPGPTPFVTEQGLTWVPFLLNPLQSVLNNIVFYMVLLWWSLTFWSDEPRQSWQNKCHEPRLDVEITWCSSHSRAVCDLWGSCIREATRVCSHHPGSQEQGVGSKAHSGNWQSLVLCTWRDILSFLFIQPSLPQPLFSSKDLRHWLEWYAELDHLQISFLQLFNYIPRYQELGPHPWLWRMQVQPTVRSWSTWISLFC